MTELMMQCPDSDSCDTTKCSHQKQHKEFDECHIISCCPVCIPVQPDKPVEQGAPEYWENEMERCAQIEKAKIAIPLVPEKEIENHYKPTKLDREKLAWQDRPDKAGEWWISRVSKISGKRIKPHHITVQQDYIDGDFDNFPDAKWLYIPEPTPPLTV
jgi:hypothetical protein